MERYSTRACRRRLADGGLPMRIYRWKPADGGLPMRICRWKPADGDLPMGACRWGLADGVLPISMVACDEDFAKEMLTNSKRSGWPELHSSIPVRIDV